MAVTIEETSTVNMTSQHASVHAKPNGHGDARRTAKQIVEAENRVAGLTDKAILITGCSSGLGVETARALLTTGAELYLTSRDVEKAKKALPELIASERVHFLHLDLQSMDCVRACAKKFLEQSSKLNILIANAGVMHTPEGKTADGFEAQFGTNFLGHYLLFNLLKLTLLASASPDFASKVVVISSSGHRICGIDFDDLNFDKRPYNGWLAYGQSKTACIYLANEIDRRYGAKGLHGLSLHPGSVLSGLRKTVPDEMRAQWKQEEVIKVMKSPEQGAATSVFGAIFRSMEGKGDVYLEDCGVASEVEQGAQTRASSYAPHAFDKEKEGKSWDVAANLVKLEEGQVL
jgi:NAD(P)-dependent dehydrogenase (short-subunit alcohol dehydrogenase family)